MALTMIQQASLQFEADEPYNAIHCPQDIYELTMAIAAYFKDFPSLPSNEGTDYSYTPISTSTWLLEPEQDMYTQEMSRPITPRELKSLIETEMYRGLTQSAILQHCMKLNGSEIPFGSAAAVAALQDAIIVASDAEWYEHDDHFITELGMSVLDPRSIPQQTSSSPWSILSSMENYHVRIKPHAHLTNKDLCSGHADAFQFGSTTFVDVDEAKAMLHDLFTRRDAYGNLRPVIFVGHAVSNDYEVIKSRFGLDLEELGTIVATIDTQVLAVEHGLVNPSRKIRLSHLLSEFGIEEKYLHNAGNDIVCTMIAAFLMLCPTHKSSLHTTHPNNLHYADLKAQLRSTGRATVKAGYGYGTTLFCEKCDSHMHTAPYCRVSVWHCAHCDKDAQTRSMAYTHNTQKCVHVIKQAALVKKQASMGFGKGGAKRSTSPNAVPCEYCIESTDPSRYCNENSYGHKTGDCAWPR
jgi:DNA polymerase III epsilon subunit-like protein